MKYKNITIKALLTFILCTKSFSFQCPVIFTGITLVHPTPHGSNWILQDSTAANNGWYVINDPVAANHPAMTVNSNATLFVYLVTSDNGNLYPICEYSIGNKNNPYIVKLALNKVTGRPTSSRYQKVNDSSYLCKTTAARPEWCANLDIWQRPVINKY